MDSLPPVARDRAAAPAQAFESPNAASTDSEASSTVAWEPVRPQKWHLLRMCSCLLHSVKHWLAIWPSVLRTLRASVAAVGAAAALPF